MSQNPVDSPEAAAEAAESLVPDQAVASSASAPGLKVELDIEDAPFLEEEEEQEETAGEEAETPSEAPPEPPPAKERKPGLLTALLADKKKLAIIGGGALALLLLPLVLLLLFGGDKTPEPVAEQPVRIVAPEPTLEEAPAGPQFVYRPDPFFLERRGSEGEIRFLRCRFSVPTDNPALHGELTAKTIALRDAIYYYLNNKPLVFLGDPKAQTVLKQDLISVINEQVATEKISQLYIEEYFISGR